MSSNKSNYCAILRTVAVVVTAILLISSIISCNNPLSGTDSGDRPLNQKTGTVSGKFTFNGAIPQELIGKNTNSTNTKTAFPTVDETTCTYEITAYDSIRNELYEDITATFNDNHTEYTLKGIPLNKESTVEVNVFTDETKTKKILTGKNTFTLTQESPIVSADIILEPIQTTSIPNSITRSVNLAIQVESGSNVGYVQVEQSEFVCTSNDNLNYILKLKEGLSLEKSEPKTVNVSFWSGTDAESKGILLYKFSETINIFDNLETNTWIKNADGTNSDPHLVLQDSQTMIADCKITKDLISHFKDTTLYVDTTASSSSNTGTFSNPFTTLQAAVNHIITNGNTPDKYTIYIKNDITILERILCITSNDGVRNITIAGYDGVKTITQESNSNTSLFDFSKAGCNITLRDLILDVQSTKKTSSNGGAIKNAANLTLENVTIQNFISLREGGTSGTGGNGGAIYNNNSGYLILKNSKIDSCKCESAEMAHGGAIFNIGTLELNDAVIVGCKTQAGAADYESYGGAIYNNGTCKINKAIITGCSAIANSDSPGYAKGGAIYNTGSLTLGDSICNSDGSPDVTIGIGNYNRTVYSNPNEAFAGAGVFSGENASFTMNRDCVIGKFNPTEVPAINSCGNRSLSTSMLGNGGAGVWIYKTNLTINGGFISYNYAENTANNNSSNSIIGVGLYYKGNNLDNLEINNLTISYNNASTDTLTGPVAGVGISINSMEQIQLNNVKVYNNSGTPTDKIFGKGIYISESGSPIILKNSFWCSEDNDIYFNVSSTNHRQIRVDSILNPQNQFGVPQQYVATITPGDYASTTAYFTGSKVAENKDKFIISNNSAISYYINSNGKFFIPIGTKYPVSSFEVGDIVFNDGSATPYSVIKSRNSEACTSEEKAAAIAVIFRVGDGTDGNKTLGVGIKQNSSSLTLVGMSTYKGKSINISETVCNPDSGTSGGSYTFNDSLNTDGSKNLLKWINAGVDDTGVTCNSDGTINFSDSTKTTLEAKYPAFGFAYYYGKNDNHNTKGTDYENGWYLPSLSELNDIYQANKSNDSNIIENALSIAGGNKFNTATQYWSSSQSTRGTDYANKFNFSNGYFNNDAWKTASNSVLAVRAFD